MSFWTIRAPESDSGEDFHSTNQLDDDDDWPADDGDDAETEDLDDDAASDGFDEAEEPLTRREENADRALRGAVIGLLFWPLQFYVVWLLLKVFVSDQRLRPDKRKRAIIAAAICIPFLLAWCVFMRAIATG